MKFSKIIGEINDLETEKLISDCQEYLSEVMRELSTSWETGKMWGSKMGGDPLLMQLVTPMPHYCDLTGYNFTQLKKKYRKISKKLDLYLPINDEDVEVLRQVKEYKQKNPHILDTAATDGRVFFWAPQFVMSLSKIGVRLLINHEGMHFGLLHPSKRGHRLKSLWNISVDYKSNFNVLEDLKARGFVKHYDTFKELGDYVTIDEYCQYIRDPYNPPDKMKYFSPRFQLEQALSPGYIDDDSEPPILLYADPNLPPELSQPEVIYDYLLKQAPRCDHCKKLFHYKIPADVLELKKEFRAIQERNAEKYGTFNQQE